MPDRESLLPANEVSWSVTMADIRAAARAVEVPVGPHRSRRRLMHWNHALRSEGTSMNIVGIDYSTRNIDTIHLNLDNQHPPKWHRHQLDGPDAWERTRQIKFWGVNDPDDILAIGLEEPRGQNAGVMYRVQGAILARLPSSVLVYPWVPSAWRKAVGLPGNASKDEVAVWACDPKRLCHIDYDRNPDGEQMIVDPEWPQDAYDAYCIALATRAALEEVAA